jgi:hypothetical protein
MSEEQSMPEVRPVAGFTGYYATKEGTIWSAFRITRCPDSGRMLSATSDQLVQKKPSLHKGRPFVSMSSGNKQPAMQVGKIVLMAWVGLPPTPKHHAAHNDGNPLNNNLTNLRWATAKENEGDKKKHGTKLAHEKHPNSKLTWAIVQMIRDDYKAGMTLKHLVKKYGYNQSTIFNVYKNKVWVRSEQGQDGD